MTQLPILLRWGCDCWLSSLTECPQTIQFYITFVIAVVVVAVCTVNTPLSSDRSRDTRGQMTFDVLSKLQNKFETGLAIR